MEIAITWARMKVKPIKSRSQVIKNEKVKEERFKIGNEITPTVSEKPVKCLRKFFEDSLSDKQNVRETCKQLDDWIKVDYQTNIKHGFINMGYYLVCCGHCLCTMYQ